jgi:signal transduction histidine kinase
MKSEPYSLLAGVSIRAKLLMLAVVSVGMALAVTSFSLLYYNYYSLRSTNVEQLRSQSQMLAFNCTGVLAFNDADSARELLQSLEMFPAIETAWLVDGQNEILATYPGKVDRTPGVIEGQSDHVFTEDGDLLMSNSVVEGSEEIGSLVIEANLDTFYLQLRDYVLILAAVTFVSLFLSASLSFRLQKSISEPIAKLVNASKSVAEKKDYSTRVHWRSENELGQLCETFDRMLDEIQMSKEQLQSANDDLECRVDDRTAQLREEILERKKVMVELESARDAAEAANKAKSEFLANMSHEIRTPLNGVLGFTDLLAKHIDRGQSDVCLDYIKTVKASGKHLLELINDVLDISKIEAGQLQIETVRCCPHEVIAQVTSVLRAQAQGKGLDLQYRWATRIPESIESDPGRLRQLIMNLVGNAVKFTDEGFVCITARLDTDTQRLSISVEDTGVGIPAEKLDGIFDPFVQADNSVTRKFGGTGLGLAISRKLAIAMGGGLAVESDLGGGSCFTAHVSTGDLKAVTLRTVATTADAIKSTESPPRTATKFKKVLSGQTS